MIFLDLKNKLLSFFDKRKLDEKSDEWGFHNEININIDKIAFAVNLTPEVLCEAKKSKCTILNYAS